MWPTSAMDYTLFLSPCVYLFTVHYCALPIEAEAPLPDPLPSPPPPEAASLLGAPARAEARAWSAAGLREWASSFDGALVLSLIASALLNAAFGALAYAFFGVARAPPRDEDGGEVQGCDADRPFICDDIVKNVSAGPIQVRVHC